MAQNLVFWCSSQPLGLTLWLAEGHSYSLTPFQELNRFEALVSSQCRFDSFRP